MPDVADELLVHPEAAIGLELERLLLGLDQVGPARAQCAVAEGYGTDQVAGLLRDPGIRARHAQRRFLDHDRRPVLARLRVHGVEPVHATARVVEPRIDAPLPALLERREGVAPLRPGLFGTDGDALTRRKLCDQLLQLSLKKIFLHLRPHKSP